MSTKAVVPRPARVPPSYNSLRAKPAHTAGSGQLLLTLGGGPGFLAAGTPRPFYSWQLP